MFWKLGADPRKKISLCSLCTEYISKLYSSSQSDEYYSKSNRSGLRVLEGGLQF